MFKTVFGQGEREWQFNHKSKIILGKQAQVHIFFEAFICICPAEMDYISLDSFLQRVFLFSPWQQALISNSCYYWLLESFEVPGTKARGKQSLSYRYSCTRKIWICSWRWIKAHTSTQSLHKYIGEGEEVTEQDIQIQRVVKSNRYENEVEIYSVKH